MISTPVNVMEIFQLNHMLNAAQPNPTIEILSATRPSPTVLLS